MAEATVSVVGFDGQLHRTMRIPHAFTMQPAFHRGGWLALATLVGSGRQSVAVVDLVDGRVGDALDIAGCGVLGPAISADGKLLANADELGLEIVEMSTGSKRLLSEFGDAPSLAPASGAVAFHHGQDELWLSERAGGNATMIVATADRSAVPEAFGSYRRRPVWSADGRVLSALLYQWRHLDSLSPSARAAAKANARGSAEAEKQWLERFCWRADFAELLIDVEAGEYVHADAYRPHVAFRPAEAG